MGNNGSIDKKPEPPKDRKSSHVPFINVNIASVIAQFLTYKDLQKLGETSKQMNFLFLKNEKILKNEISRLQATLQNYEISIEEDVKDLNSLIVKNKILYQKKNNPSNEDQPPTQGFIAVKLRPDKQIDLIFSSHPIAFDWRDDPTYWPVSENKKSLFIHKIPHLLSVCWFRMNLFFKVQSGKSYEFYIRMAGDSNFNIREVDFFLDYKDHLLKENKPLIKSEINKETTEKFIKLKGEFDYWLMGTVNLQHIKNKEVELHFYTTERSGWWKVLLNF